MLTPDRGSFVLINQVQVKDIAGSALYRMRIEVTSQTIRRCGKRCIDDGTLDLAQVTAVIVECVDESLRGLNTDLMLQTPTQAAQETLSYVLDGQRVVAKGKQL